MGVSGCREAVARRPIAVSIVVSTFLFAALVAIVSVFDRPAGRWCVIGFCVLANALALIFVIYDKCRAKTVGWRVKEATLLALLWATGVFGAWVAMLLFQHKIAKWSFLRWALLWTVLNPLWVAVWGAVHYY